MTHTTVL